MLINGYANVSITTPECHSGTQIWCADFQLDADVSHLFPYINAVVKNAAYHEKSDCIIFVLENVKYSICEDKVTAAPFRDRDQAIESIHGLINFLNDLENRKASIPPNHKKYQPPVPVLEIFKLLPRTNCKKCDFSACMAFAAALSKQEARLDQCQDFKSADDEKLAKLKSMVGYGEDEKIKNS